MVDTDLETKSNASFPITFYVLAWQFFSGYKDIKILRATSFLDGRIPNLKSGWKEDDVEQQSDGAPPWNEVQHLRLITFFSEPCQTLYLHQEIQLSPESSSLDISMSSLFRVQKKVMWKQTSKAYMGAKGSISGLIRFS